MKIISAEQMKALDKKTVQEQGVSALVLMERAGAGVADLVLRLLNEKGWPKKVVLFAGKGNNGGDAFVAARLLDEKEVKTQTLVLASFDQIKGEAKENLKKLRSRTSNVLEIKTHEDLARAFSELQDYAVAIDGMVGTGSKGPALQGLLAEAADLINATPFQSVVAIDIPSGLDPNKGIVQGTAVRSDHTMTLGLPKRGLVDQNGLEWVGRLHVLDLGFPDDLLQEPESKDFLLTPGDVVLLGRRSRLSHKGTYGHLLILGGSPGLTGAPSLAAWAALRTGTGLVTVGIAESLNSILEIKLTEPMTLPLREDDAGHIGLNALDTILKFLNRATAVVIGPGLGTSDKTVDMIHQLLPKLEIPTLIDADGLNAVAKDPSVLKKMKAPVLLTPHPGEMARLVGGQVQEVQAHRWEIARDFAKTYHSIVVLKGAGTVITSWEDPLFVNVTGNPGMAIGGMGDVLAGMIGGLLAQGMQPFEAAKAGVYLHGLCGDEIAKMQGEEGFLASDLIHFIPRQLEWLKQLRRRRHESKSFIQ